MTNSTMLTPAQVAELCKIPVVIEYQGVEYRYSRTSGHWYPQTGRDAGIRCYLELGSRLTKYAQSQGHWVSMYPAMSKTKSVTSDRKSRPKKSDTFIPLF
jgi:hypothetical protein